MYEECTRTRPDLQTLSVVSHPSQQMADTVRVQITCLRTVLGQTADIPRLCTREHVRGHFT